MTMKRLFPLFMISFVLLGCSGKLYVTSDYDKEIDFSLYQTFAWAKEQKTSRTDNPMFDNELNRKRIREAIEKEMERLGFRKFDKAPDLLIDFHLTIDKRVDYIVHDYYPFGFHYWSGYDASAYTYQKGALVIHFVDSKKEQLVWQGVGSKTLADVPSENVEERIRKAVKAILAQYNAIKK